jgi:hypothetical protein
LLPAVARTSITPSSMSSAPKYSESRICPRRSSPVSWRSLSLRFEESCTNLPAQ